MSADDRTTRLASMSPEERRALLAEMLREKRARPRVLPVSFEQLRLWFLTQLTPESSLYNEFVIVRLEGELDGATLQKALDELVVRHEGLRTTFELRVGETEPVQVVHQPQPVAIEREDLAQVPAAEREEEARRRAVELINRLFDLSGGPLLRVHLFRLGEVEHELLLSIHHIVFDGWSSGLICRDLAALYGAFRAGEPSPLAELSIQYGDFAAWQRRRLQGETLEHLIEYWRGKLAGTPPLELPVDFPRPARSAYEGAREWLELPEELAAGLEAFCGRAGTTLHMVVLAAFEVLLHRYSGQDDVAVGSLFANRNRTELEELVGCFVNTLVMRTDLSGDPTFREVLERVRDASMEAFEHRELPFERIVEELHPQRDLGRNPLFDVSFVLMSGARPELEAGGLTFREVHLDPGSARFDLEAYVFRRPQEMEVLFNYRTDLFEAATIRRMLRHFEVLLTGIVADPDRRISQLPLLSADERRTLLVERNATERPLPQDAVVHDLFEAQVGRTPDAIAAEFGDEGLSYAELAARANRLARHLRTLGVAPGERVAICLDRSLDMLVAVLGALEAGGAYVPLDPLLPEDRIAGMLEDSAPAVVLTDARVLDEVRALGAYAERASAHTVALDRDAEELAALSGERPEPAVGPEDLAYLIFTSGSTGKPKGVQIRHRAVVNFLRSMAREPGLGPDDTLLAVTNLTFDISVLELLLPLTVGARVVVASRAEASDPARLQETIGAARTSVMQATPATWELLVQSGWQGGPGLKLLCGGEALSRPLADQLLDRCGELWNLYGPTETTIWSTAARVERARATVGIGGPIDNTRVYVLDASHEPVPVGVAGELYIGGEGLARGYLDRPELTAERFVEVGFDEVAPQRLYRTGDLVRYRSDGSLDFLGRNDHQIKLRGFRIELGEIEAALLEHPEVGQCVVQPFEPQPGDRRLAAYVVSRDGSPPSSDELRSFVRMWLPEYMIPAAFVELDALPLSSSGKVDRRSLPIPEPSSADRAASFSPPETPMEQLLAEVWQEVLSVDRVGIYDNFFDLGGHSLLTVQVVMKLEERAGVRVELRDFFLQTLGQIATRLEREGGAQVEPQEVRSKGIGHGVRSVLDRIVALGVRKD